LDVVQKIVTQPTKMMCRSAAREGHRSEAQAEGLLGWHAGWMGPTRCA